MRVEFALLDVFCERPFAGNQLCVVPEPGGLDAAGMQTVAREIGFSETTFVTGTDAEGFRMRIFTPGEELPFAGHPTLGTSYYLVADRRVPTAELEVCVEAGTIPVWVELEEGTARMRQLPPIFDTPLRDRASAAHACLLDAGDLDPALPVRTVSTGLGHLIVPVRDAATLERAERDGRSVRRVCERTGAEAIYLFAVEGEGAVTARMFDGGVGIGEDPATGSAAGPLGAYLSEHRVAGMPGRVRIHQGAQVLRPSTLVVDTERAGEG